MNLNSPDTRQDILRARLVQGDPLIITRIAAEFDVSPDTVRRDLIALEQAGQVRRVRGGAVPMVRPSAILHDRLEATRTDTALIAAVLGAIADAPTLLMDGGTTVLAVAARIPPMPGRLIVTPAPRVAIAAQTAGIDVVLVGGALSARGGIATGLDAERHLTRIAADVAILGACGIDPAFGLSADDLPEAGMKRQMADAANRTFVVTSKGKLHRRARHRVLSCADIDTLITDATPDCTHDFANQGMTIIHA